MGWREELCGFTGGDGEPAQYKGQKRKTTKVDWPRWAKTTKWDGEIGNVRVRGTTQDLETFRGAFQEALGRTGLTIAEVARKAGASRDHLARLASSEYVGGPPSPSLRLSVALALMDTGLPDELLQRVAGVDQLLRSSSIRRVVNAGDLYSVVSHQRSAASALRSFAVWNLAAQCGGFLDVGQRRWFIEFLLYWVRRAFFGAEGPFGQLRSELERQQGAWAQAKLAALFLNHKDPLTTTAVVLAACSWHDPWLLYPFSQRHPAQVHVRPYRDRLPERVVQVLNGHVSERT